MKRSPHRYVLQVHNLPAMPYNLVYWGCESWSLYQSLIDKIEVLLHRSIRRILSIRRVQGRERKIKDSHICTMLYNILYVRNQVTFRHLTYVGKILRHKGYYVLTRLLNAWCNNPWKRGGQLLTNKKAWFGTSGSSYLGSTTTDQCQRGDFTLLIRLTSYCCWPR